LTLFKNVAGARFLNHSVYDTMLLSVQCSNSRSQRATAQIN